ncbi:MAG: TIGR02757 family protein [Desulfobacteraceae bacterium]
MRKALKEKLEQIYSIYNKKEYIDPDPLLFLYNYRQKKDREIAALIAACFAYGQVAQIMKTVGSILETLAPSPFDYILNKTEKTIVGDFKGFKYRFAKDHHLTALLLGIKNTLTGFSSLEDCFCSQMTPDRNTVQSGLEALFHHINPNRACGHLMADPCEKSACKRSHLFLRWMVRKDRVDPGGWKMIRPAQLIVPLDTHMYKTGILLGFTERKGQDIKTALDITHGFSKISPEDPVKYDFCLTRFGIRKGLGMDKLKNTLLSRSIV